MAKQAKSQVIIMVGLPGSGKTYHSVKLKDKDGYNTKLYHLDEKIAERKSDFFRSSRKTDVMDLIASYAKGFNGEMNYVIDGLFLTNKGFIELVSTMEAMKQKGLVLSYTFYYFKPDVDVCLHNDKFRRSESSSLSIKNMKVEKPDLKLIAKETGVELERLSVKQMVIQRKDRYQMFKDKYGLKEDKIQSCTWSLGGYVYDYTGSQHDISAEPPREFDEFDELMERIKPDMTIFQYKKIYRQCVESDDCYAGNYYGGNAKEAFYVCYLRRLFDILDDMELLDLEEDDG